MDLEKELSQALRRKEPSPDFAARVAARVAAQAAPVVMPVTKPRVFAVPRWLPVAAAVLVVIGGVGEAAWRRHQGMVAKEQVMLAMRITAGKLNHIQTHVREAR
ncbi:MAG TPA: hypothetical protein VKU19_17245 [Bryobacteraceae bacterium]|nr:hypothetical protein [Bryobacteraceae bacterium]